MIAGNTNIPVIPKMFWNPSAIVSSAPMRSSIPTSNTVAGVRPREPSLMEELLAIPLSGTDVSLLNETILPPRPSLRQVVCARTSRRAKRVSCPAPNRTRMASSKATPGTADTKGTVVRVVDLLRSFAEGPAQWSLSEIAERVALPRSTTHRLLQLLRSQGFVDADDGDGR